jgi:peptidyl-prolyl cis-trans isomerase SurA
LPSRRIGDLGAAEVILARTLALTFAVCAGLVAATCQRGTNTADATPAPVATAAPAGKIAGRHILVRFAGVRRDAGVTRRHAEAQERIAEALAALKSGEDFAAVAARYSDDPTAHSGGWLGVRPAGGLPAEMERALRALKEGELSGVVETPYGLHVFKREVVVEIRARHILVAYAGARAARDGTTRTRDEAQARAEELRGRASAPGADFAALAREASDDPTARNGGDLGHFGRGMFPATFDDAAFALVPGTVSRVVETPFGFHVILRVE